MPTRLRRLRSRESRRWCWRGYDLAQRAAFAKQIVAADRLDCPSPTVRGLRIRRVESIHVNVGMEEKHPRSFNEIIATRSCDETPDLIRRQTRGDPGVVLTKFILLGIRAKAVGMPIPVELFANKDSGDAMTGLWDRGGCPRSVSICKFDLLGGVDSWAKLRRQSFVVR